ncbi:MAG: hypothetical protein ACRCRW_13300 [Aeromonadaceae bacterium]
MQSLQRSHPQDHLSTRNLFLTIIGQNSKQMDRRISWQKWEDFIEHVAPCSLNFFLKAQASFVPALSVQRKLVLLYRSTFRVVGYNINFHIIATCWTLTDHDIGSNNVAISGHFTPAIPLQVTQDDSFNLSK